MSPKHTGASGTKRFAPRVEALEDRSTPAGDVKVAVINSTLFVFGDNAANRIWIIAGEDKAIVRSIDSTTTLNGTPGPVLAEDFDDIVVHMGGGNDGLFITGAEMSGGLSVNLGDGFNVFQLIGADYDGETFIIGGNSGDAITLRNSQFHEPVMINTGAGDDQITTDNIGAVDFWMKNPAGSDFFNNPNSTIVSPHQIGIFTPGALPAPPPTAAPNTTPPTPTITTTSKDPTNANLIPFLLTFDEDVTGFDQTDLTLTNASVASFAQVDGHTYSFALTPSDQGTVSASVAAGVATDSDGNANVASNVLSVTFDSIAPVSTVSPLTTKSTTPVISGTVNDPNATVTVSVNGKTYTAAVSNTGVWAASVTDPLPDGTFAVVVTATDKAGNVGTSTSPAGLVVDATAPTAGFTADPVSGNQFQGFDATKDSPVKVTITFSEPVVEVSAGSLDAALGLNGNATRATAVKVDSTHWTVEVTPNANGMVTLTLAAGAVKDSAGNTSEPASYSFWYDTVAPDGTIDDTSTGTINGTATDATTRVQSVSITIKNSSNMYYTGPNNGFSSSTPFPLPVAPVAPGDFSTWFFTLPITGVYNVTATITDTAGNVKTISQTVDFTADTTPPVATITSTENDPTNATSIPISVSFDEDVIGFDANDLTGAVSGGTASGFQQIDASHYTFNIAPAGDGTVTFTLAAGAVTDRSNNPVAQTPFSIVSDRTAPGKPTLDLTSTTDSGTVGDLRTDRDTVDLTGTAEVGATVVLTTTATPGVPGAGTVIDSIVVGPSGHFTFTNVLLDLGPNSFAVQATDPAGNKSTTFAQTFTRNQPPVAGTISDQTLSAGGAPVTFTLTNIFTDAEKVVRLAVTYPGGSGNIDIGLFDNEAHNTVDNFLKYVNGASAANYDGSVFHRLESGFVLQGGSFKFVDSGTNTASVFPAITTSGTILNQPSVANTLGTIAMAKGSDPDSATSGFFFNLGDNSTGLDDIDNAGGFTVFGQVMNSGQQTLSAIASSTVPYSGSGRPGFGTFPVSSGANLTSFPANINASDVVLITDASELSPLQRMSFSVDNPNPSVATASITNGVLTVTPAATATGTNEVTFTVTATDLDGSTTTTTFKVTVTGS